MRAQVFETEQRWKARVIKTGEIEYHLIDRAGNYFIDGQCVNPLRSDLVLYTDDVWRHPDILDVHAMNMNGRTKEPLVLGTIKLPKKYYEKKK